MDSNATVTKKTQSEDQVVVVIPHEEEQENQSPFASKHGKEAMFEATQVSNSKTISSPEIIMTDKPPKIPKEGLTQRKNLAGSAFSKEKSRFAEPSGPVVSILKLGNDPVPSSPGKKNVEDTNAANAHAGEEEEEDEDIYKIESVETKRKKSRKKLRVFALIELLAFVVIWGFFVVSLTVDNLNHSMVWGLDVWKWCVLVMAIVSGRLMCKWLILVSVFLIEKNFLLKNKVLYFIYGVRNCVHIFIWSAAVLLTWVLLINRGVERSHNTAEILNYVSRALISISIATLIWLIKTLLVKLIATNFQSSRFFDRIQESLFHQYVLMTISGPPVMELSEEIGRSQSKGQMSFRHVKRGERNIEQEVIDVNKLHKLRQEKVSAWTMKGLVNVVTTSGLSTISSTIDQIEDAAGEQKESEITNEWEAKAAAIRIFKNVATTGTKYIDQTDLLRFLSKEELVNVLPLFEGAAATGKIKKSALRNWVVKVYQERKSLAHSLNDSQTAVKELNVVISSLLVVVIIVVCLLIMGIANVQVLVFISSQMVVAAFIFGNTAKTIFESIIFVFVMHPFDAGDRCVIDGVQLVVEEMNILNTVFLRYDNEKIYYPNSVLATKPISNFYRSPDMGDNIEFSVDVSTTAESIGALKARIKSYIDNKPKYWSPTHFVVIQEIENMNKMKMVLYMIHTINYQNFMERNMRRTEMVMEMKRIFQELSIKYNLLPQEVVINSNRPAQTGLMMNAGD